ncbi:DUF3267 domain-containing protein [Listeria kieliensis]
MKLKKEINLINDKKFIKRLNWMVLGITVVFIVIFQLLSMIVSPKLSRFWDFHFSVVFLITVLFLFLSLLIHEGIHGLFFKLFSETGSKVIFGYKNGLLYASSPNSFYSRNQFIWISIAPFFFITSILTILFFLGWLPQEVYVILATVHGSGCVGDFYWCYLLIKEPKTVKVEDTEVGFRIYES